MVKIPPSSNRQPEGPELQFTQDLLRALEVGNKKEDRELIDELFLRHNILRPRAVFRRTLIHKLAHKIVEGPGFEPFFLDVALSLRPFALMLQETLSFLSHHATTIGRRSAAVSVSRRGAEQAFDFDLSAFPKESLHTILNVQGHLETLRMSLRAIDSMGSRRQDPSSPWQCISTIWDKDFCDNGFFRLLSYATTLLAREDPSRRGEIESLIDPVLNRLAALVQILRWPEIASPPTEAPIETTSYEGPQQTFSNLNHKDQALTWELPSINGFELNRDDTIQALWGFSIWERHRPFLAQLEGVAIALHLWHQKDFHRRDHTDWLSARFGKPFEDISLEDYLPALEEETWKVWGALDELFEVERAQNFEAEVDAVLEFLNLPFWRDRWFLYELWTAVHVLDLASRNWHLELLGLQPRDDGGLEWSLPGGAARSPIARIKGPDGTVECWTQLKTYHPQTGKGLEPDLRLMRASEWKDDLIVIENKDRLKPRKSEMAEILERYVTGTRAQVVWLVNYEQFTGPTHSLGSQWPDRSVAVVSHFRPGEAPEDFGSLLLRILTQELGIEEPTPSGIGTGPIPTPLSPGQSSEGSKPSG